MAKLAPLRQVLVLAALAGRGPLAANLLVRVLQGALPLLGLLAMQRLLDAVATGIDAPAEPHWNAVLWATGFAAAVALLGSLLGGLSAVFGERHARLCADRLAERLQRHTASLDLVQLESPAVADLLHRAAGETQRPARIVQDLAALTVAMTSLLLMVAASAMAAPWLPLLTGLAAVPQVLARGAASRRWFAWQEHNTERQRRLGYLGGLLAGRAFGKDLRALELAPGLLQRVGEERTALTHEQVALMRTRHVRETAAQIVATAALFAAYVYLAHEALFAAMSLGTLLLQVQAVQRTQNGVRDVLLAAQALRDDQRFAERVQALLALAPAVVSPAQAAVLPPGPLAVACTDARWRYPGGKQALDSVTFRLEPGERVLLTGPNGAGKSTIVRLLARLMDPDQGVVEVGGLDVRRLDPLALRARLSVLFQDAHGLEGTVRDNLAFGAGGGRDAELLAAADLVGLGDELRSLPQGLDTTLGRSFAGAVELSAGQWRRLLLARTLLRPADLLVLDEPFAFLDAKARHALLTQLTSASRRATVLVVDHDPAVAAAFDRVLVCDRGRLVAVAAMPRT